MDEEKAIDYNAEPVFYCKRCLSLRIMGVPLMSDCDYCDNCGSTDIAQCSIEEWENLYEEHYGFKFLNNIL